MKRPHENKLKSNEDEHITIIQMLLTWTQSNMTSPLTVVYALYSIALR